MLYDRLNGKVKKKEEISKLLALKTGVFFPNPELKSQRIIRLKIGRSK
jgi:hypothetical protein